MLRVLVDRSQEQSEFVREDCLSKPAGDWRKPPVLRVWLLVALSALVFLFAALCEHFGAATLGPTSLVLIIAYPLLAFCIPAEGHFSWWGWGGGSETQAR
jgi:hypothetical protein